jgi:hypothetical protein
MRCSLGIYNSRNPEMFPSCLRWLACLLLLLRCAFASDWRIPEAQLAEKIAAITGPGVIALNLDNRSSISSADIDSIRHRLVNDLGGHGIRVWDPDQAAAVIAVTFSENLQSYVWVAEVHQGTAEPVLIMLSTPRPETAPNAQNAFPLVLRATPLISSPDAILDLAVVEGNPRRVLALSATSVTIYDFKDNRWIQAQALPVTHSKPFPRDLRGRVVLRSDHLFDAYLPGVFCRSANSSPLTMNCSASDDPWPLQTQDFGVSAFFSPARNFFTGALAPGIGKQKAAPPFYAAAAVPGDKYALWIFAGVDGQLHLFDGINQQTLPKVRWGSDIAGIHADCRPAWQVIATSAGDENQDALQAFEFPDREPVAVSQKMNLNGEVTALWPAHDGKTVVAVYRDAENGNYEAVQLTLTCSQ